MAVACYRFGPHAKAKCSTSGSGSVDARAPGRWVSSTPPRTSAPVNASTSIRKKGADQNVTAPRAPIVTVNASFALYPAFALENEGRLVASVESGSVSA